MKVYCNHFLNVCYYFLNVFLILFCHRRISLNLFLRIDLWDLTVRSLTNPTQIIFFFITRIWCFFFVLFFITPFRLLDDNKHSNDCNETKKDHLNEFPWRIKSNVLHDYRTSGNLKKNQGALIYWDCINLIIKFHRQIESCKLHHSYNYS